MIYISKDEIIEILNNHPYFEILSEYTTLREPIIRKCKTCGDIRKVNARCMVEQNAKGELRKCSVCVARERALSRRKSHKQFVEEMKQINPNIEILSEYTTNDCKVSCRCLIDNYIWETKPHILVGGHGCPKCADKMQNRRSHEEYIQEMKEKHPNIIPLDQFEGVNKKMHFRCTDCNYEWHAVSNALLNKDNSGCPKCLNHARITEQEFIERMKDNKDVEYVSGYIDMMHHANFKCKSCNNVWDTLPTSVLKGRGCPKCNTSQGEKSIEKALDILNIEYIKEYTFDDCKDIRALRYDFYLPKFNTCIEYDGEQHYHPVKFSSSVKRGTPQERYEQTVYRDNIKTQYCIDNNIKLIRIPYTEFNNIEKIINKHFS